MTKQTSSNRINSTWLVLLLIVLLCTASAAIGDYYAEKSKTLTVAFYTGSSWDAPSGKPYQMIDYAIKKFHRKYPDVKIQYETGITKKDYINWLSGKIVSGQTPDVILVPDENFATMASEGVLASLDRFIDSDKLDTSNFYQPLLSSDRYSGAQYALPYEANPQLMIYNQSLLEKYGLPSKLSKPTVDEFEAISTQLSKVKEKKLYGTTSDFNWYNAAAAYQDEPFNISDRRINLTSSRFSKAIKLMQQLYANAGNMNVTSDLFDEGKVAFEPIYLAQYRTYTSYPYHVTRSYNFQVDCCQMPSLKGSSSTSIESSSWGIANSSSNKRMAWQFIQMLCSDQELQQKLMASSTGSSVLKSVVQSRATAKVLHQYGSDSQSLTNWQLDNLLKSGKLAPRFKEYTEVVNLLNSRLNTALQNGDVDTELYDIQSDANNLLK